MHGTETALQPEDLEFHPHNDTWLVVANCLAAICSGCGAINGTSLGKGERTGNAPLEGVLLHLMGMDHKRLTYLFNGRQMRLTDVHGELIPQLVSFKK